MDVDGPLNPFEAPWFAGIRPGDGYTFHELTPSSGQTYSVALNPEHGDRLLGLSGIYDLVWATTWRDDANRLISPILGLPTDLPVVPLLQPSGHASGVFWKASQVADWVGPRSFAWFDDEIDRQTRGWLNEVSWLGAHHARYVSPETGLKDSDFEALGKIGASL